MTVEAELFAVVGSGAGGYFAGWGAGKLIKIVIKIVAIVTGAFIGVLMYMQSQGFVQVQWDKLQDISNNAVNWIASSTMLNDSSGVYQSIAGNIGIPVMAGIVPGFFFGFMKGVKG